MSQSFSAFELVQTALHLNRQLVEDDPLEALEEAFKLLSFAENHRTELGKNRFVERVDKKIGPGIKAELSRARKGEPTENYVQIGLSRTDGPESSFNFKELLRARRAHPDLLKMTPKGHLKLLNLLTYREATARAGTVQNSEN
jgi:hypothetical protein